MTPTGRDPTPEEVRGLWGHMTERFDSSVIDKRSAVEMRLVGRLLGQLRILDPQDFLARYATTFGDRIYLPFTPGVAEGGWDLFGQIVVCAHEHQHVHQARTLGMAKFAASYLLSASARADFEAEAYRASLELGWWHARRMPDPDVIAHRLAGYAVGPRDIAVAAVMLRESAESIRRGAVLNQATVIALAWLDEHAPEVRAAPG